MEKIIIDGIQTNYGIEESGRIYNLKTKRELKGSVFNSGYRFVNLVISGKRKNYLVHRLVAKTFIPNTEGLPVVNHKDGNKQNNQVSNLEWTTYSENTIHAYKQGLLETRKGKRLRKEIPRLELEQNWRRYQDSDYYCSKEGEVWNSKTKCLLRASLTNDGYCHYSLRLHGVTKNALGHHLVYYSWNPTQYSTSEWVINHKDGCKANNALINLERITKQQNVQHACYNLGKNVTPVIKYNDDKELWFPSLTKAAEINKVSISSISLAIKNKSRTRDGYFWRTDKR